MSSCCCCYSKSHRTLVSQRALVPVVCQLDSYQSEAVVGSSSDVTSPPRSRHMSSDIDDHCSPATSPEPAADSHVPAKGPTPRGLVDALSRYFTPSDKRRSRVSLNALPHASPRSLLSQSLSLTSAADTTHTDDALSAMLPPKRRPRRQSESARPTFWKRRTAANLSSNKTFVHSLSGKSNTGDIQAGYCDSPTSQLSPGTCLPSESKPEVVSDPTGLEASNAEATSDGAAIAAESSVREELEKLRDSKQRKRRKTQLNSLHDSLSHYFTAEGERKRTPAHYMANEFSLETYHPLDYHVKHARRHRLLTDSQSQSKSPQSEAAEPPAETLWPSSCYRLSNFHLPGYTLYA